MSLPLFLLPLSLVLSLLLQLLLQLLDLPGLLCNDLVLLLESLIVIDVKLPNLLLAVLLVLLQTAHLHSQHLDLAIRFLQVLLLLSGRHLKLCSPVLIVIQVLMDPMPVLLAFIGVLFLLLLDHG